MIKSVCCPYCGAKMVYKQLDHINGFFECPKCLSTGPARRGKNEAYDLAQHRYEPPIRPLTLEEATGSNEPCVYLEVRHLKTIWAVDCALGLNEYRECVFVSYLLKNEDAFVAAKYGKEYRCWSRKPTDAERAAAEWEVNPDGN